MAESPQLAVQIAHIALLRADATIQGYVGSRVVDYIPRKSEYPYVIYQVTDDDEWDTDTDNGQEMSVYIHVWDDAEGTVRARRIMQRCYELLHNNVSTSLTDHNLVNCRRQRSFMERDGQLYHGMTIFRVVTEEN